MGSDFPSAFCYRLVVPDVLLLPDVVGFVEDGAVVLCVVPEELPELVLLDDEPPCAVHTFESCSSVIAYS